jgi:hypothetical protein
MKNNNAKCYIGMEIRGDLPVKSIFQGNVEGFKIVASTLIHLIAKSTEVRTKDVLSEIINVVAFAENVSPEMMKEIDKMLKEKMNE